MIFLIGDRDGSTYILFFRILVEEMSYNLSVNKTFNV